MALAKPAQVERLVAEWPPGLRLLAFAGRDEGASRLMAARAARALAGEGSPLMLMGAELEADPLRLAEAAASIPLFGGVQPIHATGRPAELLPAIVRLLEAPAAGNPVIVETGELRRTDRLHALLERDRRALLVLNHAPEPRDLARLAVAEARRHGLLLPAEVAGRLVALAGPDASVVAREVEKLALFLDARPDAPREARPADAEAVIARADGEEDLARLALAVLAGDGAALDREMRRAAGLGAIPALRALARRLLQLLELAEAVAGGRSPRAAVEAARPPVFWKDRAAIEAALAAWRPAGVRQALEAVRAAEAGIKAPGSPGDILGWQAIARLAAGRGIPDGGGLC